MPKVVMPKAKGFLDQKLFPRDQGMFGQIRMRRTTAGSPVAKLIELAYINA
jgi:hypothetical protein